MAERKNETAPAAGGLLAKARRYCAYQERSHQEVRDKLYAWGLHRREVEAVIARMISDGYLNETRFAEAYAGGKFRMKSWGRVKIKAGLKRKKVSDYNIRQALASIDEGEYRRVLEKVIGAYARRNALKDPRREKQRLARYAIGRGFEPELVWDFLGDR
jgi:regulatory protein